MRYTPRTPWGERLALDISEADLERMRDHERGSGLKGTVTDLTTGVRYRIYGASCGLPHCMCDAVARVITEGRE